MKDIDNKYKGLFINVSEKFTNFKTNLDRKAFHYRVYHEVDILYIRNTLNIAEIRSIKVMLEIQ